MWRPRPLRKRKTKDPCLTCYLHKDRCICALIPRLALKTKLTLVIHNRELRHTTNTGRLAISALTNSEMIIRGSEKKADPLNLAEHLDPNYRTLLLYPSEEARPLDKNLLQESHLPIQLIVPDGSWRQASKVHYRHHELQAVQRVTLSHCTNPLAQTMRKESKEHGMATLQAIAFALGIIESIEVEKQLLGIYEAKLKQTLLARGLYKSIDFSVPEP